MSFTRTGLVLLYFCSAAVIVNAQSWKDVTLKKGKLCVFGKNGPLMDGTFRVVKMESSGMVRECGNECLAKSKKCKGFQLAKTKCYLLKYPVFEFKKAKNKKLYACGRVGEKPTRKPTSSPTEAPITQVPTERSVPTPSPTTGNPTIAHGKHFNVEENTICDDSANEEGFYKRYKGKTLSDCDNLCGFDDRCMAYTWKRGSGNCNVYRYRPEKVKQRNGAVCARLPNSTDAPARPTPLPTDAPVPSTPLPTEAPVRPTALPTEAPTKGHGKEFFVEKDVLCNGKATKDYTGKTVGECNNLCGFDDRCIAYSWNPRGNRCTLYHERPLDFIKRIGAVCARLPKPTDAPVPSTPAPTKSPTVKLKCTIQATLGYPFKDPDDAKYYGQHSDWIEVSKIGEEDGSVCSAYMDANNAAPKWCRYHNTDEKSDSAHFDNAEDYYYDDVYLQEEKATRERVNIKEAQQHVTLIEVHHWLFPKEYYPTFKSWNDHMVVPGLEIFNLSHPTQDQIGRLYKHPATASVRTHIKRKGQWIGNPDYIGNFRVEVHCNSKCFCEAKKFETFGGFFE